MADIKNNAKPLRVLIVGMGDESITFLDRLVNGLAERGMEIIIASPRKPRKGRFHRPDRVKWLWVPAWEGPTFTRLRNLLVLCVSRLPSKRIKWLKQQVATKPSARQRLMEFHRLLPFTRVCTETIYFPWNTSAINYRGLYQLGIPVVVSCRGSQVNIHPHLPGKEDFKQKLRESFTGATVIHCVSQNILEEATEYGLDQKKATVIHPAIDPEFFQPAAKKVSNSSFTIITTGSLIWRKGYEYALLAIYELVKNGLDCRFEIIGDGPEKSRILYTIQDLGLHDQVVLHGKLEPNEVLTRLQQADAFLLSSLSEGISNAVLEAMSCGLPVVTTDCSGMREAVTDGVEGFVVPVRDAMAMADKLQILASEPLLRVRMGQAARERVIRDFDLRHQIDAFQELFTTITNSL